MGTRVSRQEVKTPHFFFGQVATKSEFNKEIIVVIKKMLRKDEYSDWEEGYTRAMGMDRESLLLAQSYQTEEIKKYFTCCECPADYEMAISFERFDNLFRTELATRQARKLFYKEEQLMLIFYDLLTGLKEFQLNGLKFGDIRTKQMVITTKNQKIKMINQYSYPWQYTAMDKILNKYDNTNVFYLAPEEIAFITRPNPSITVPNPKTEAFSLGICILEAALLQNSEELYVLSPRGIDLQELGRRLSKIQSKYPTLWHYLRLILVEKPEDRLSSAQLWVVLKVYSEQIAVLRRFSRDEGKEQANLQAFRTTGRTSNKR